MQRNARLNSAFGGRERIARKRTQIIVILEFASKYGKINKSTPNGIQAYILDLDEMHGLSQESGRIGPFRLNVFVVL